MSGVGFPGSYLSLNTYKSICKLESIASFLTTSTPTKPCTFQEKGQKVSKILTMHVSLMFILDKSISSGFTSYLVMNQMYLKRQELSASP